MGRHPHLREQPEEVGREPAGDRSLAGDLADHHVAAGIEDRAPLGVEVAGGAVGEDEGVLAPVLAVRDPVDLLRLARGDEVLLLQHLLQIHAGLPMSGLRLFQLSGAPRAVPGGWYLWRPGATNRVGRNAPEGLADS